MTLVGYFIILILLAETTLLVWFDRFIYHTWFTPLTMLAVPYTSVVILAFLFAPSLGFIALHVPSVLVWVIGLFVFWLAGIPIGMLFSSSLRKRKISKYINSLWHEKESKTMVLILSWVAIAVLLYGLVMVLQSLGIREFGSDKFAELYGSGVNGHIRVFSLILLIFLIGTVSWRNKTGLITISVLIFLAFIYPTKSWTILPILAGFIYRFSVDRTKLTGFKILFIAASGFIIFIANYLLLFIAKNNIEVIYNINIYKQLLSHFGAYVFAGVLALGEVMKSGTVHSFYNPDNIFAPFLNLYAVITSGDLISPVVPDFTTTSLDGLKKSNVHTFFGTLWLHLGFFASVVYVLFSGTLVYGLFAVAHITKNCWAMVAWSFIAAMLALGWFEFYFWHLSFIEIPVYCLIIFFLYAVLKQLSKSIRRKEVG